MTEQNHMNLKFYSMIEDRIHFHNIQHVAEERRRIPSSLLSMTDTYHEQYNDKTNYNCKLKITYDQAHHCKIVSLFPTHLSLLWCSNLFNILCRKL